MRKIFVDTQSLSLLFVSSFILKTQTKHIFCHKANVLSDGLNEHLWQTLWHSLCVEHVQCACSNTSDRRAFAAQRIHISTSGFWKVVTPLLQRWHSNSTAALPIIGSLFHLSFLPLFLYFCLSPGWLSEWVVGCVASSLTAVWEPSCHSYGSLVPLSFWSQSPLI